MVETTAERVRALRTGAHGEVPVGVVINAAILFRMGLHALCDEVVYVTAPFIQIWKRARDRDGASLFDVLRRLRSQRDVDPQFSHPDADIHTVENHGNREELRRDLAELVPMP
jgi:dephospho-CoA kinase